MAKDMKQLIVTAALTLWRIDPSLVTAREIGKSMGLSHVAILYHWGTMKALKDACAREAVALGDRAIVPQLIVSRHPAVAAMDASQRQGFLVGC